MPDDRKLWAYPIVGIPTAYLLNDVAEKARRVDRCDMPVLVYDHVGIGDQWTAHLKWLDENISTVRAIRVAEAGWARGRDEDGLAYEIRTGELTADDALANLQRTEQNASIKAYKAQWVQLRSQLDPIFEKQGLPRPKTFAEAFQNHGSTMLPALGKGLLAVFDRLLVAGARTSLA